MCQNRDKLQRDDDLWEPFVRYFNPALELLQRSTHTEPATLQFDRGYLGRIFFFADKYVVATLLMLWNRQIPTVQIDNNVRLWRSIQTKLASVLIASGNLTVIGHFPGNLLDRATHFAFFSWTRLKNTYVFVV